jgi:uncharacterized RDD family membrane protein YckC
MSAHSAPAASSARVATLQGQYAGVASRAAACIVDAALSFAVFAFTIAAVQYVADLIFEVNWDDNGSLLWGLGLGLWEFFYYWYSWGMAGKTPGAALLGIRVVRRDGHQLGFGRAFIRALVYPLSFLFFGLGLWGALFGRERRTLHDVAAGSTVIYDWDARAAHLRFLARRTT